MNLGIDSMFTAMAAIAFGLLPFLPFQIYRAIKAINASIEDAGFAPVSVVSIMLIGVWTLSLFFPVVEGTDGPYRSSWMGYEILVFGVFGVFNLQVGWIANVTFWSLLPLVLKQDRENRIVLKASIAVLNLACAWSAIRWSSWPRYDAGSYDVTRHLPGYYLWLTSILGIQMVCLVRLVQAARSKLGQQPPLTR